MASGHHFLHPFCLILNHTFVALDQKDVLTNYLNIIANYRLYEIICS